MDRYLSGSWYNANQDGHGLSVEILPDSRALIYWYVYHPDGTPTFLIAIGTYSGNRINADAYYNSGMKFGEFDPDDRTQVPWGTLMLTYNSCTSATLQYSSSMDHNGVPYGSGTIPMTRLASIEPESRISDGTTYDTPGLPGTCKTASACKNYRSWVVGRVLRWFCVMPTWAETTSKALQSGFWTQIRHKKLNVES